MPQTSPMQLQLFPVVEDPVPVEAAAASLPEPSRQARPPESPSADFDAERSRLLARLEVLMPGRVGSLALTENRSTIVSTRDVGGRMHLRIHRCFTTAPEETLAAVVTFLLSPRRSAARRDALSAIRAYFQHHRPPPAPARRRRVVLRPVGRVLDLRRVRDELNETYFDGELEVAITWGRSVSRQRRRGRWSVRLGTYSDRDRLVRVHRCLDRPEVPRYVVESVVYHEMLHAAVPPVVKNGRRRIHTLEFRRRERLFSHHDQVERWLARHLPRLLGTR